MRVQSRFGLIAAIAFAVPLLTASAANAQQFELLSSFAGCPAEGCTPNGDAARPFVPQPPVLAPDGYLYGTSSVDWPDGATSARSYGTVYRATLDGSRTLVHVFTGSGAGECGTGPLAVGSVDGAIYGLGAGCGDAPATIFRISGNTFQTVYEFPDLVHPISLVAGSNGALYGSLLSARDFALVRVAFRFDVNGTLTPLDRYIRNFTPAPDGNLYFIEPPVGTTVGASLWRLRPDDRIERVYQFPAGSGAVVPEQDLIAGENGLLYGTARVSSNGLPGPLQLYRITVGSPVTTFFYPVIPDTFRRDLIHPLATTVDGSVYVSLRTGDRDVLARIAADGALFPVHEFEAAAPGAALSLLTLTPDRHLYGVYTHGGAHGLGVLYRIRLPRVDVTANGADGPIAVAPGDPLQISMAFELSPTAAIDPAEVFVAVVTPASGILWATPSGFSTTAAPLYAGPLPSLAATSLFDIPDAAVLPSGDYYWVAIVDADSNGVPNGHYVDFVKTTRTVTSLASRRK